MIVRGEKITEEKSKPKFGTASKKDDAFFEDAKFSPHRAPVAVRRNF